MIRKFEVTAPVTVGKKKISTTLEFSRTQAGNFRTGDGSMHILDMVAWFLEDPSVNPVLALTTGDTVPFRKSNGMVSMFARDEILASIPTEDLERFKVLERLSAETSEMPKEEEVKANDAQEAVQ